MTTVDLPLLPLGRGVDLNSERGVECPGDLPAASDPDLVARARAAKEALGDRVFVLGHHYQRDEVIQFADVTGDSFKLAREAAARPDAEYIVFCGVHFMAESADILTSARPAGDPARPRRRLLDGRHGPADPGRARLAGDGRGGRRRLASYPVTYMNSSADIKAFCGRNGGVVCTSSNAEVALEWAFEQKPGRQGAVPARPAPGPQHRGAADGPHPRRLRRLGPAPPGRRPHRASSCGTRR